MMLCTSSMRDLAAVGGIEAELLHFRAAGEPVGADKLHERRAGVVGDLQAGRAWSPRR